MRKFRFLLLTILLFCLAPLGAQAQITAVTSLHSGNWDDTTVWDSGHVPTSSENIFISAGHVVTVNVNSTVSGVGIDGELRFIPSASVGLTSTANIVVSGTLAMKPATSSVLHTIRFSGITESNFVGGGIVPLATDVGLWVMDDGILDAQGTAKTAWTYAAGSIAASSTQLVLTTAPTGWQVGDEISIAPTEPITVGTSFYAGFDLRTISAINGVTITLSSGTTRAHPAVTNPFTAVMYTAEVLNLSRNVRIEGTGDGNAGYSTNHRAHVFIHSTEPQDIEYVAFRYLGPRQVDGAYTQDVLGRYGLHFHMMGDYSRGSLLEGVVVRDTGAHAFVPHASHGITLDNTISYNTFDEAFWWDFPPDCNNCETEINDSNDITVTHAVAALVRSDPTFRGYNLTGFVLGEGEDNTLSIENSVAVGVQGNTDASGFEWLSHSQALWIFTNNLSHNNKIDGMFIWQNNSLPHIIENSISFNNGESGIDHGAYGNAYRYVNIDSFGNGMVDIRSRASARGTPQANGYYHSFTNVRMTGLFEIAEHNATYLAPTLVRDCLMGGITVDEARKPVAGQYDFVNCIKPNATPIESSDFTYVYVRPASVYRVQRPDGTAFQITGGITVTGIPSFYPTNTPTPTFTPTPTPTCTPTPTPTNTPTNTPTPTPTPTSAAVVIGDTFDRSDDTDLNASNSGKTLNGSAATWQWTETGGDAQIAGNLASNLSIGASVAYARAEYSLATVDHYVEVSAKLGVVASTTYVSLLIRYDSATQTYYELQTNNSGTTLYKVLAGTRTSIATSSDTLSGTSKTVKLWASGSTISASFNGSTTISITDTSITAGTRTGIGLRGANVNRAQIVSFTAGDN
jgi:hypothetical protein